MRRLLWAVVLFFAVTFVTFVIFFVLPVSEEGRFQRGLATEQTDIRRALELDGPLPVEYAQFVKRIVIDHTLGSSFANRRDVNATIAQAAPVTISVIVGGALLWMAIAIPVGILSALRPRSLLDRTAMTFVLLGVSAHPAWIGLVLAYVFGHRLHATPFTGYCEALSPDPAANCGGLGLWAYHLLLPWITFAMLFAAIYVRMIRASVLDALEEDYVRTARAKGATGWRVLRSHVVRNAMLPVVTMLGMDMATAIGTTVFVEQVYGLPGLGKTALTALARRDLPPILGVVTYTTLVVLLLSLVVDLLYAAIDPRIRVARANLDPRG